MERNPKIISPIEPTRIQQCLENSLLSPLGSIYDWTKIGENLNLQQNL